MSWVSIILAVVLIAVAVAAFIYRKFIIKLIVELIVDILIMLVLFFFSQMLAYLLHLTWIVIAPAVLIFLAMWKFLKINMRDAIIIALFFSMVLVSMLFGAVSIEMVLVYLIGVIALAAINITGYFNGAEEAQAEMDKQ
jgi:hypothetical protein